MNTIKAIFKGVAILLVLVLIIIAIGGRERLPRAISATGVCVAKIQKDKFSVTLQIKTLDKSAAASLRAVQNAADDMARRIKAIEDKTLEVQTTNLYSYEKTEWKNNASVSLGVESQIDLEITTGSKDTINAVLEATQSAKNAQVFPQNMRNFSSRETTDAATAKCLEAAVIDARAKAAAMAAGDGRKVGGLVAAGFGSAPAGVQPIMFKSVRAAGAAMDSADYIQSSDGDLSVKVDATFNLI